MNILYINLTSLILKHETTIKSIKIFLTFSFQLWKLDKIGFIRKLEKNSNYATMKGCGKNKIGNI